MPLPTSRRRFLQWAGAGLALASTGAAATRPAPLSARSPPAAVRPDIPVLLNLNECPYGPSAAAQQAARNSIAGSGRYQNALAARMRERFAELERIDVGQVRLHPGSSDALNHAATLWTGPKAALVIADPTFETLGEMAAARGAHVQRIALRSDGAHDVRAMTAAARAQPTGLIYICNPNNPTGSITPLQDLEWLLANKPASTHVLVDEAYLQYSQQPSLIGLVGQRQDLIVLRTFSKLYGMAGMRLGIAAAHPLRLQELAGLGNNPMSVLALAAGLASLDDASLVQQRRKQNARLRQATIAWLGKRGHACLPSEANCFMVDVQRDGDAFIDAMKEHGVLVGRRWPVWPQWVRVTVGTEADMERFREAFIAVTAA